MELVITLLVAGALLLVAETVLPGLIAGIVGACCLVAGIAVSYTQFGERVGNVTLLAVLLGFGAGCWFWVKYFPGSRLAQVLISQKVTGGIGAERPELLHQQGTAITALRPAGTALILDKRVDVEADGQFIERGAPIRVVAVEGARVVVRSA